MSFKTNLLVSYISQLYVAVIGIVLVPVYIKYMGVEAYGLVGFFAMLQVWFNLLDAGLMPTIARETARYQGGAINAISYRSLVRALEGIFLVLALVGSTSLFFASDYIANDWLKVSELSINEVEGALKLMAIVIALRWICGLYRGVISGSERLIWLGGFNSAIATLRFVGVLPLLIFYGATPTIFFGFQLGVALVEFSGLLLYAYRLLPPINATQRIPWNWTPIKPVLKFSLAIAFASFVSVIASQADKLILSKLLPLAEYGYFTLGVLVASGVMLISAPISGVLMPRMVNLEAKSDFMGLINIYRQATQLVSILVGAVCVTLVFCAEPILVTWTGDVALARKATPILILYSIGNGILSVAAFPYYLQYAKGNLRMHLIGNILFVTLLIPLIVWGTNRYGGIGAGYVWLAMNLLSFIVWLPLIHKKFEVGLNKKWYWHDVLPIIFMSATIGFLLDMLTPKYEDRSAQFAVIILYGLGVLMGGAVASSLIRSRIKGLIISFRR